MVISFESASAPIYRAIKLQSCDQKITYLQKNIVFFIQIFPDSRQWRLISTNLVNSEHRVHGNMKLGKKKCPQCQEMVGFQ